MYHRERRKMTFLLFNCLLISSALSKSIEPAEKSTLDPVGDNFENNIIDFDEDFSVKFNKKYGAVPWESSEKFNKEINRYTVIKDKNKDNSISAKNYTNENPVSTEESTTDEYSVIPLELVSTTQDALQSIIDSTTEPDLTVIPLSTTAKSVPEIEIEPTVTLPSTTEIVEPTTDLTLNDKLLEESNESETTTIKREVISNENDHTDATTDAFNITTTVKAETVPNTTEYETTTTTITTTTEIDKQLQNTTAHTTVVTTTTESSRNQNKVTKEFKVNNTKADEVQKANSTATVTKVTTVNNTKQQEVLKTNSSRVIETFHSDSSESREDLPSFSELDASDETEVPEDYYDNKDVLPTTAPKTDALSVIFGLAGSVVESVVESVAEKVVPKSIFDLFKRMQKQNEALEAERLRSREENGGLGQFGRGILKSISTGLSKPLSQLMQGVRDIGSLDTDRGFVGNVASGVTSVANVANSVVDAFKDRVQAIYPGTVWCGDGHSATARSSDLGLFFFTDTCCRQHDACKIYIKAGETKYGLTNTGLFTRSHCSCDSKFRECLRKTNSLVSAQIGLTYFNVLGPQCFRKAHPIVKCNKRTRITGQKCEEYELDFTKPKMWQWFDNETF